MSLPTFQIRGLANITRVFATWRVQKETAITVLSQSVSSKCHQFAAQGLGNIAWAFATLKHADATLFEAIASASVRRACISELSLQNLANIGWAFATLHLRDVAPGLFDAMAKQVMLQGESESLVQQEQSIANLVWGFAKVKVQSMPLMNVLASKLQEVPFTMQGLANVAWAFAEQTFEESTVMRNLLQAAVQRFFQRKSADQELSVKAKFE